MIEERVAELEDRMSRIEQDLAETVRFQAENTRNLGTLITETREIVELHRDIQSAIKVGSSLQRFAVWFMKLGAALSGLYLVIQNLNIL